MSQETCFPCKLIFWKKKKKNLSCSELNEDREAQSSLKENIFLRNILNLKNNTTKYHFFFPVADNSETPSGNSNAAEVGVKMH